MTAYLTRSPLQLLTNPHYIMAEQRQGNRRTSARLREKEDAPVVNGVGVGHAPEKGKSNGTASSKGKPGANSTGSGASGTRSKRKLGRFTKST